MLTIAFDQIMQLANKVVLDPRPEFHRCHLSWATQDGLLLATSTGSQLSSRLLSMKSAAGMLKLPAASESLKELEEGSLVDCLLIDKIY